MNKLYTIFKKLEGAYADTTIRAYEKNMKTYVEFCDAYKYSVLPSSIPGIVHFIDHLVELEISAFYIRRHLTAIAHIHKMTRHEDPTQDPDVKIVNSNVKDDGKKFGKTVKSHDGAIRIANDDREIEKRPVERKIKYRPDSPARKVERKRSPSSSSSAETSSDSSHSDHKKSHRIRKYYAYNHLLIL